MSATRAVGPRLALAITGAGVFLAYLDITAVNVALPTIAGDLGADLQAASWIVTAYNVVVTALLVTAGRIADAKGRRATFMAGLLLFAVGSALCALAWDVPSLVAFRVVQGIGAATLLPVSLALLLPAYPASRRGAAIGAWGSLGALAAGVGPPVGGVLAELDWRVIFLVNVPVALGTALGVRRLAEPPRTPGLLLDGAGVTLIAVGVGAVVLAIVEGPDWGWGSPRLLGLAAVVVVAAVLLVLVERRAEAPVLDLRVLGVRSFAAATAASTAYFLAFFGYSLLCVLAFQGAWQLSPLRAGLAYALAPLAAAVATPLGGRLVDRVGPRRVAVAGTLLYLAVLVALGLSWPAEPGYLFPVLPILLVGAVALSLIFPALTQSATTSLPSELLAGGTGVLNTIRQVGGVVGIALVVTVLGGLPHAPDRYRLAFLLLALSQAAAVGLCLLLPRRPAGGRWAICARRARASAPRAVQAAVRSQFVRTSRRCAAASKPARRRAWQGTDTHCVSAQTTSTRPRPSQARTRDAPAGGASARSAALAASTSMSGPTTTVMRRSCAAWNAR